MDYSKLKHYLSAWNNSGSRRLYAGLFISFLKKNNMLDNFNNNLDGIYIYYEDNPFNFISDAFSWMQSPEGIGWTELDKQWRMIIFKLDRLFPF